jgi:hypothetical protein
VRWRALAINGLIFTQLTAGYRPFLRVSVHATADIDKKVNQADFLLL